MFFGSTVGDERNFYERNHEIPGRGRGVGIRDLRGGVRPGGATTAAAVAADVTEGAPGTHATPAAVMAGTYELFLSFGSGFGGEGQLYLNSDTSWSLQRFSDGGSWATVGRDARYD